MNARVSQVLRPDARPPLRQADPRLTPRPMIGQSEAWCAVVKAAARVAVTDATVLLIGESGTGKEVVARFIHESSPRSRGPFVALNCAAVPEALFESEVFGYERGAFTGAQQHKAGQVDVAAGGVLFLDEVSEMCASVQAKFLRVLQEHSFQRLGGTRAQQADVRVIAATNRNLKDATRVGEFRQDLYYRLQVFEIRIPPLRDRPEDIVPLADAFLGRIATSLHRTRLRLSDDAKEVCVAYGWPGNVRELHNAIERAAILSEGDVVAAEHLSLDAESGDPSTAATTDLNLVERGMVEQMMHECRGNKSKAAQRLGLSRRQLYVRLRRHQLA
jgi:transcriptional regulator with PAS, ATPase and Fis domain